MFIYCMLDTYIFCVCIHVYTCMHRARYEVPALEVNMGATTPNRNIRETLLPVTILRAESRWLQQNRKMDGS